MRKLKNNACKTVICAGMAGIYLIAGAVEQLSIGILQGVAGASICLGAMLLAYGVMLIEEDHNG